jgi:hypothetical protein
MSVPEWPITNTVMSYKAKKRLHRALVVSKAPVCGHIVSRSVDDPDYNTAKTKAKNEVAKAIAGHRGHKPKKG